MIHVEPQPEPATFDAKVRRQGLSAVEEMIGNPPIIKRKGPRRKKIADRIEDIPPEALPAFWRDCLDDLHSAYGGICAYVSVYIDKVTGARSVDHYVAKSRDPNLAYEWNNYRLACGRMNARKNDVPNCLDPFEVQDDWFQLELTAFQVRANPELPTDIRARIEDTVERLGLQDDDCCAVRRGYVQEYEARHIDYDYLQRRAPFVARELRRQGRLHPQDA